jgi:hypothetical protein
MLVLGFYLFANGEDMRQYLGPGFIDSVRIRDTNVLLVPSPGSGDLTKELHAASSIVLFSLEKYVAQNVA